MYYRLREPYCFRGWKLLPYAIRCEFGEKMFEKPYFFDKETFLLLLCCNGTENIELENFSKKINKIFQELLNNSILESFKYSTEPLKPYQRYHIFNSRFLESVHWAITGKCNYKCRHCIVSAPCYTEPEISLKDCKKIIDKIAECGVRQVDITGGEPLVRKDYERIFELLAKKRIFIGVLFTNAKLLDNSVLESLKKNGHKPAFQISFDGVGHHDWLRGIKGAEQEACRAFQLLKEKGYRCSVAMSLHRENYKSLRDTAIYLAKNGIKVLRVNAPQKLGMWSKNGENYSLSENEVFKIYEEFIDDYFKYGMPIDVELDGYFSCKKGSTDYKIPYVHHADENSDWQKINYCESAHYNALIDPTGRVMPCMGFSSTSLSNKFPNILENEVGEITLNSYYSKLINTKVSDLLEKNISCRNCKYLPKCCGGCMLESIKYDVDYLVPDERCCYFHKHIGEERIRKIADTAIKAYVS